jgi:hypothetical protein
VKRNELLVALNSSRTTAHQVADHGDEENHQEYEEQDFCDSYRRKRYSTEAQNTSDDGDDQGD